MAELKPPVFFADNYLSADQKKIEARNVSNARFLEHDYPAAKERFEKKGLQL